MSHCYEKCVPTPGTSLSQRENTCMSACAQKYMNAWDVVSRSYVAQLQQQRAQMGGVDPGIGSVNSDMSL